MRIIPAIDVIEGKCVRLSQGDYSQKTVYNENPLEVAREFENTGLKYLHLVDLDGAKAGKVINWKVIEAIVSKTKLKVDFGGGIKNSEDITRLLGSGVQQVNLGSIAVKSPEMVLEWMERFGPDKVILSADVKDNLIQVHGWQTNSNITIQTFVEHFTAKGIQFVTCTDISTDGMLAGPNVLLYQKLLAAFPHLKLIASGGVSSIDDVAALANNGLYGAIIGKAIYENRISLTELAMLNPRQK